MEEAKGSKERRATEAKGSKERMVTGEFQKKKKRNRPLKKNPLILLLVFDALTVSRNIWFEIMSGSNVTCSGAGTSSSSTVCSPEEVVGW